MCSDQQYVLTLSLLAFGNHGHDEIRTFAKRQHRSVAGRAWFDKRPDPPMGSSILTPYAETGNFRAGELVDYFFVYVDNV